MSAVPDDIWNRQDVIEMILCEAKVTIQPHNDFHDVRVPYWMLRQLQQYHQLVTGRYIEIGTKP